MATAYLITTNIYAVMAEVVVVDAAAGVPDVRFGAIRVVAKV